MIDDKGKSTDDVQWTLEKDKYESIYPMIGLLFVALISVLCLFILARCGFLEYQ